MATATWYLVRYTKDPLRREPRNVGIVVRTSDGQWLCRFLGRDHTSGKVDGRTLPLHLGIDVDIYRQWIEYFTSKMSDDAWNDALTLGKRRRYSYGVELGGHTHHTPADWAGYLNHLFTAMVV